MKIFTLLTALFIITPQIASAQSLQTLIPGVVGFIDKVLIPFLFGLVFFIFVYSAFKYFILESANEKGRENAKNLAIYGVFAFVFVIIFFGIVEVITSSTGLQNEKQVCPDYLKEKKACPSNPPIPGHKPPVPEGFTN